VDALDVLIKVERRRRRRRRRKRRVLSQLVQETATCRCDDTTCCIYNFDLLMKST